VSVREFVFEAGSLAVVTRKRSRGESPFATPLARACRLALVAAALATPVLAAAAEPAAVASPARYERVAPSPDGIGKRYMGREIAQVMGWQGAAWLERAEREQEERTDLLLRALDLRRDLVVADIGAGTGFVARRMADRVGPAGRVWAVDVQPEMVRALEALPSRSDAAPIRAVLGAVDDVRLSPASIDLAVLVDVYHELEFPYELLASIVRALKPGGRVALVEYRGEDPAVPIKPLHKMTESQVRREAALHALAWERTARLPWQNVVIFRKTAR
jgi:SAM-dependent methyltransferase